LVTKSDIIIALENMLGSDVEISHLYRISALSIAARGNTDFDKIALFIVAAVFNRMAEKIERDGAGEEVANVSGLISIAVSALSSRDWDSGKPFLVELTDISNRPAQTH